MQIREIQLENLSKRFKRHWLFQDLSQRLQLGERWAVLGSNGSGKSTLLKCLCGSMSGTSGNVIWRTDNQPIPVEEWHQYFAYSSPYLELIDEFTLDELLTFHFNLKTLRSDVDLNAWLVQSGLDKHRNKIISRFSSGMMQRLKLILCLASKVDVYFLDEPCSNLDLKGVEWYQEIISTLPEQSLVIIASNSPEEYQICKHKIHLNTNE